MGTVRGEVQKLRVLAEANESQIKLVAEVQARHGEKLDELTKAVEPIARIEYFIETVATEHELRLRELEKRVGSSQIKKRASRRGSARFFTSIFYLLDSYVVGAGSVAALILSLFCATNWSNVCSAGFSERAVLTSRSAKNSLSKSR